MLRSPQSEASDYVDAYFVDTLFIGLYHKELDWIELLVYNLALSVVIDWETDAPSPPFGFLAVWIMSYFLSM